jgi:hypothetical protein
MERRDKLPNMRTRSGVISDEEDLSRLSPEELSSEIARCEMRLKIVPSRQLEKPFESRIRKLSRIRDRLAAARN